MEKRETKDWEAFALFNLALGKIDNYKKNRNFSELDDAREKLELTIAKDPTYKRAIYHLAILYDLIGEKSKAIDSLVDLIESEYRIEALYALGVAYFHQYTFNADAYKKAIKYFTAVIDETDIKTAKSKKNRQIALLARAGLANVYAHQSILPPGKDEASYATQAEQYFVKSIKECNEVQRLLKRPNKLDAEIVIDINWLTLNAKGVALMYKGRRERDEDNIHEAEGCFQKALGYSTNSAVLCNLGTANLFLYDISKINNRADFDLLDLSIRYFNKVLQIKPNYDFAFYRLARIYRRKGDFGTALKYWENALQNRSEIAEQSLLDEKDKILRRDES
jgi:tetratricopeptide (TPR) repeat protein